MATPPARATLFPAGALTPANAKTYFGQLYDYIYALLGTDGTPAVARNALLVPVANYLINPDGAIYQRTIAAATDDTYIDDRWYALTQTASITPSQVSNPEDGYRYALRLTQSQVAAQRMGRAQILEGKETSALRGKTVTFGGRFKLSTTATLRYAIIAWTGTEDTVTSDVVLDWTSGTYTTGNFFTTTTCTLVATGSTAMTAATAATCSVSGSVPSGATNLVCLYWTEATAAQNVTLDAWDQRLVEATALVGAIKRSFADELRLCQRFFQNWNGGSSGFANGTTICEFSYTYPVVMRVAPTLTVTATSCTIDWSVASNVNPSSPSITAVGTAVGAANFRVNNYTGLTSGQGVTAVAYSNPYVTFSAEL